MRFTLLAIVGAALLGGCAAKGPTSFEVAPGQYATAFAASREVLRSHRFTLERVDADRGVMSTGPKYSSGLFTPWDTEQSSLELELADTMNQQSRRVRITFEPSEAKADEARVGRVEVAVYRMQDYGLRPNPRSIMMTTRTIDPKMSERGVWPQYEVAKTTDAGLARRLAREIEAKLRETP
ncbi:MAG: hypothetical protein ACOYN0_07365 [Phycisphaerales bacterium]